MCCGGRHGLAMPSGGLLVLGRPHPAALGIESGQVRTGRVPDCLRCEFHHRRDGDRHHSVLYPLTAIVLASKMSTLACRFQWAPPRTFCRKGKRIAKHCTSASVAEERVTASDTTAASPDKQVNGIEANGCCAPPTVVDSESGVQGLATICSVAETKTQHDDGNDSESATRSRLFNSTERASKYLRVCHARYRELLALHCREVLKLPEYKAYEMLWALSLDLILWDDLPPNSGEFLQLRSLRDQGIDLFSVTAELVAQVKLYSDNSTIGWREFGTFFAYATRIVGRALGKAPAMLLLTTPEARVAETVQEALWPESAESIDLLRKSFDELLEEAKPQLPLEEESRVGTAKSTVVEERWYLKEAYQIIANSTKQCVKLQLPCGTGKTYIALYTIQKALRKRPNSHHIIFCPWKDLTEQTCKLFQRAGISTAFVGDSRNEFTGEQAVIVCVSASAGKIPTAITFMYVFIDEAHHVESTGSVRLKQIKQLTISGRIVQLSATFRKGEHVDYVLPMTRAIEEGYMSDYVVHIPYFSKGDKRDALIKLLAQHGDWAPMFLYFNSKERCQDFCRACQDRGMQAQSIVGQTRLKKRCQIARDVKQGLVHIVCLCGVYNEGVSIDCLRTVVFADLRYSETNRQQIAMRANRLHDAKPFYRIVVPLVEADFKASDIAKLVKSFCTQDARVGEALAQKVASRVRVTIDEHELPTASAGEFEELTLTQPVADLLYEEVYDRLASLTKSKVDGKVDVLLQLMEHRSTLVGHRERLAFSDGTDMYRFWLSCKVGLRCFVLPYSRLLGNDVLNDDWNRYLRKRGIKPKVKLKARQKVKELLDWVEMSQREPRGRDKHAFSDGTLIGKFWRLCKERKKFHSDMYSGLLENDVLMDAWQRYLEKRSARLTTQQKVQEFLAWMETSKVTPRQKGHDCFSDGSSVYEFWHNCKVRHRCFDHPCSRLLENTLLKNDWSRCLQTQRTRLTQEEKVQELLEWAKVLQRSPRQREDARFTDQSKIGLFWGSCKTARRCVQKPYDRLLDSPILRDDWLRYCQRSKSSEPCAK
eukprot:TRINITY_DN75803_c0_g1_i1.p1 TRINITY_DN75803_c0_g1~~TRINITY_DN75803_c0_g1_i1.p1  ORF type:complete len:1049 (-),score=111.10 TRINITY_DN75803_c0_g1_i1:175-3321(-)